MNRLFRTAFCLLATTLAVATSPAEVTRETLQERLRNCEYVIEQIMQKPETAIPASILQEAKGVIISLSYRGGFLFGGQGGVGVLIARNPLTGEWGVPAFVRTGGANFGLQIGVKEISSIYVIMDEETMRKAYSGRFNLAADAGAVAGPKGFLNEAIEGEDFKNAHIYVYTNTRGLFVGVSVKAGWVAPDNQATQLFYDTEYRIPEIALSDWFELPPEAQSLIRRLEYYESGQR